MAELSVAGSKKRRAARGHRARSRYLLSIKKAVWAVFPPLIIFNT